MMDKEILEKLDEILQLLGKGRQRSTADIRRKAEADVIRLTSLRKKRKQRHECADKKHE